VVPAQAVVQSEFVGEAEVVLEVETETVLISVAVGVALGLAAATARVAVEEIVQIVERQNAAMIQIEVLRHRGPAEFKSGLPIVRSAVEGIVVQEVQVAVDAPTRIGFAGAKAGETANINHGQTVVFGREIGIGCVQAKVGRVNANVLGGKS